MVKTKTARLMLMRSGRTEWDLLGRVQGAADLPLAAGGRALVEEQMGKLAGQKLGWIACAPDEASRATAEILKGTTGAKKIEVVSDLGEMALGLWEGLRYQELEERFCRAGRQFLDDPCGVLAPDGEGIEAYAEKVRGALAWVAGRQKRGAAVGVVVRPIALGVSRCILNTAELGELWAMLNGRPDLEWYQISKNDPRLVSPPRRPRRSVSAA
jgi:probable phosphoglycerate mutase